MKESQLKRDYAKRFYTGAKGTHPLVYIVQIISVAIVLFILFNYATAVDEKYVDERGNCIRIVEVPAWGDPVDRSCDSFSLTGRYEVIVVKNR